jgi:pyruvate dehydrogenase E1 component beta subunit
VPGLTVVVPTTPHDVKGLLKSAIRGQNPVIVFEEAIVRHQCGDVPEEDYTVPIGVADVKRVGSDLTIVAVGAVVHSCLAAAERVESDGISVEVVDVRTVVPFDQETILDSVAKTGRLVVVDSAPGMCSVASEIAASVAERAFNHLKGPIIRVTAPHVPVPFSPELVALMYPTTDGIAAAIRELYGSR